MSFKLFQLLKQEIVLFLKFIYFNICLCVHNTGVIMIRSVILLLFLCCHYSECKHCNITKHDSNVFCDCTSRGFRSIPKHIPNETTDLDLSNNRLELIRNYSFNWLTNLRTLKIWHSHVAYIEVEAFSSILLQVIQSLSILGILQYHPFSISRLWSLILILVKPLLISELLYDK
jgi:hypothetical protein